MDAPRRPGVWSRIHALVLGLIPGLAHVLVLDRPGVGAVFFLLFIAGVDAMAAAEFFLEVEWAPDLSLAGILLASGTWLVAFLDMARLVFFRDYEKRAALRKEHASRGVRAFAAGRTGEARKAFRACLAMDSRDVDALFWLGCVEARRGKKRRARRAFQRCLQHDAEDKWKWECGRELAALDDPQGP